MKNWLTFLLLFAICVVAQNTKPLAFEKEEAPEKVLRERAVLALNERLYDIAIANLEEYMKIIGTREPDFVEATTMMAEAYLMKNYPREALQFIELYQGNAKHDVDAAAKKRLNMLKAQALAGLLRWDDAITILEGAVDANSPENDRLLLAECYLKAAKYDKVVAMLSKGQGAASVKRQFLLAEAYLAQGSLDAVKTTLDGIKADSSNSLQLRLLYIRYYAQLNESKQALDEFDKVKTSIPETADDEWYAAFMSLGNVLAKAKEYPKAIAFFLEAEKMASFSEAKAAVFSALTRLYINVGEAKNAKETLNSLKKLVKENAESIALMDSLARLLDRQGSNNDAAELFMQLAKIVTDEAKYDAVLNAATSLEKAGKFVEAYNSYLEAEKNGANDAKKSFAALKAAEVATKRYLGSTDKTTSMYDLAVQALTRCADVYAKSKDAEAAANGAEARFQLAQLALSVKAYTAAIHAFETFQKEAAQQHPRREEAALLYLVAKRYVAKDANAKTAIIEQLMAMGAQQTTIADKALMEAYSLADECHLPQKAEEALNAVIAKNKTMTQEYKQALRLRCLFYLLNGQLKKGHDDFDKFDSLFKNDNESEKLCLLIGDAYSADGVYDTALAFYLRPAAKAPIGMVKMFAIYEAAEMYGKLGKYAEALSILATFPDEAAIKANGLESNATTELVGRLLYLRGDLLSKQKEFEKAIKAYEKCRIHSGNSIAGYSALGRMGDIYMEMGGSKLNSKEAQTLYASADKCFKEILAAETSVVPVKHPLRIIAKARLAVSLCRQDKTEDALLRYEDLYTDLRQGNNVYTTLNAFYFQNAVLEMGTILAQKGDAESLEKLTRYYQALVDANLGVSDTALERLKKMQEKKEN